MFILIKLKVNNIYIYTSFFKNITLNYIVIEKKDFKCIKLTKKDIII